MSAWVVLLCDRCGRMYRTCVQAPVCQWCAPKTPMTRPDERKRPNQAAGA